LPQAPARPPSETLSTCQAPRAGCPLASWCQAAALSTRRGSVPSPSSGWTLVCSRSRCTPAR
jgi:hypothetical protein